MILVYCTTLGGTFSESLAGQMQGALAQEWQAPFQASATPQMAGQRLARREPPESTMTALQRLTRETTIACALCLVLALSGGSESTSKSGAVH
jgi:hypothetical protein